MPRKQHSHHYIYKTTCIITNRFYIGMHSTSDMNDGYIGSGKRLWNSINKHGKDNHKIEILEFLPDRESLKLREKELVNEKLINDPLCMNLQLGGGGGLTNDEHKSKWIQAGKDATRKKWQDPEYRRFQLELKSKTFKRLHSEGKLTYHYDFSGQHHTIESKEKIGLANSIKQKGESNSQFGTMWITNGIENLKIKKEEFQQYKDLGWDKGRKMFK